MDMAKDFIEGAQALRERSFNDKEYRCKRVFEWAVRRYGGVWHLCTPGKKQSVIFRGDDYVYGMTLVAMCAHDCPDVQIITFELMSNHVHLVVEDQDGKLSEFMKFVTERYAMHYAQQIGRTGGIFRKPFWSEPIENDNYLLCAVRYVHANPEAARICRALEYPWSSVDDYLGGPNARGITSTDLVMDMLGSKSGFIEFHQPQNYTGTPFSGSKLRNHLTDEETIALAAGILGHDPRAGTTLEEACLLADHGFPHAHIARITGITATRIRTALSKGYSLGLQS